jgi:thiol-disulfide isomerase/thioredoxin
MNFFKSIKELFPIILLAILFSCNNKDLNVEIITGKFLNPTSDTINIIFYNGDKGKYESVHSIYLKDDNSFTDTLTLDQGYYKLSSGKNSTSIFLQKGFNLDITGKQLGDSIHYTGIGANENNYLVEKDILYGDIKEKEDFYYVSKLTEDEFLILYDSLNMIKIALYNKHKKGFGEDFSFIEKEGIELMKNHYFASFEEIKQYLSDDRNYKVSDNFPNPYEYLNLDDDRLLKLYIYKPVVDRYIHSTLDTEKKAKDYVLKYLEKLDKIITNPKIKEELAFDIGMKRLKQVENLKPVYLKLTSLISNEECRNKIENAYNNIKRILPGKASPQFTCIDMNNESVSLEDFKGKYLYIDIWATWCKPCIREIPDLEKLRNEYESKGIEFISICKSDKKDNWEKFVTDKNLKGIQLFDEDSNSEFFKIFEVNSIPRFIIIDKDGNIYDADAPRPSSNEIMKAFNELI